MLVNRQELLDVLIMVRPGLSKKDIVEQATHFIFTGESIVTYNDDICVSHPYITNFKISIKAQDLYKVLSDLNIEEVDLSVKDSILYMKGGKTRSGLQGLIGGDVVGMLDILGLEKERDWNLLPTDFIDGLFLCMFSASRIVGSPLNSVNINGNLLQSTDNYRISRYELNAHTDINLSLPIRAVQELISFPITYYYKTDSWVYFKTEQGAIFCCRYIVNTFPDTTGFFDLSGASLSFPDSIKNAIDEISAMAVAEIDYMRKIDIRIENNTITCRAEKDRGWIEKDVDFIYSGSPLVFSINPIFFRQVLDRTPSMLIAGDRALFLSEGYKHLMALPKFSGGGN